MGANEADHDHVAVYRPPGRPGLKFEKVGIAADELLREGSRPTVEKIRAKVGGSPNTIIEHLDRWWASLTKRIEIGSEAFVRLPRSYAHLAESFFHQSMEEFRRLAREEAASQTAEAVAKVEQTRQRTLLLDERERELSEAIADRDLRIAALETALIERSNLLTVAQAEQRALLRRVGSLTSAIRRTNERLLIGAIPKDSSRPKSFRSRQAKAVTRGSRAASKPTDSKRHRKKQRTNRKRG